MRVHDWPARLAAHEARCDAEAFRWGTWDCCLAAAAWVAQARGTGYDHLPGLLAGAYTGTESAARAIAARGGDLGRLVGFELGQSPLATPRLAQRGDLVLVPSRRAGAAPPMDVALAVVCGCGTRAIIPDSPRGAVRVPLGAAILAWRV